MILIYTTHKNKIEAEKITNELLSKKLIACANYFPIEASLFWNGVKSNENELVALYKTKDNLLSKVEKFITENHPYEVPCIIRIDAKANNSYEDWINNSVID